MLAMDAVELPSDVDSVQLPSEISDAVELPSDVDSISMQEPHSDKLPCSCCHRLVQPALELRQSRLLVKEPERSRCDIINEHLKKNKMHLKCDQHVCLISVSINHI